MKVLYRSSDIGKQIKRILEPSRSNKRTIFVAYVGADWKAFLPSDVRGLKLVCSLTPGATSPTALAELQEGGVEIWVSNRLHAKVYCSNRHGCVLTSANLSRNGLGIRGLREIGVLLEAGVEVDRIWQEARARRLRDRDIKHLENETKKVQKALANVGRRAGSPHTFQDWHSLPSKHRPSWKLGQWYHDDSWDYSMAAKEETRVQTGRLPYNGMDAESTVSADDWLLCFRRHSSGRISNIEWVYTDFVVRTKKSDPVFSSDYPFQAIQAHPLSRCPWPPFTITPSFKIAFAAVAKKTRAATLDAIKMPSAKFLNLVRSKI